MDQHLIFLLLGLANGAVFASLAMALVVTYRSSGVLNFAPVRVKRRPGVTLKNVDLRINLEELAFFLKTS